MKICILSWYPTYNYREKLKLKIIRAQHPYSWVTNLSIGLSKNYNVDVHIISFNREIDIDQIVYDAENRITIHYLSHPISVKVRYLTNFFFEKKKLSKVIKDINPDLIHGQGTGFPNNLINKLGKPYVITVHGLGLDFFKVAKNFKERIRLILQLIIEQKTLKKAKNVIIISQHVENYLNKYNFKIENKYFIENSISEKFFNFIPNFVSNRFIFIGNDVERKGLFEIIKILKKITTMELTIISTDQTGFYKSIISTYIKKNNLNNRIFYYDYIENSKLPKVLSECLCLLLPSVAETAPMVIAEANAVGIPVIAYNSGGVSNMIEDNVTGFVIEKGDLKNLYIRIKFLLENKGIAESMGKKAKELAIEKYHPNVVAQKTYNCYLEILNNYKSN